MAKLHPKKQEVKQLRRRAEVVIKSLQTAPGGQTCWRVVRAAGKLDEVMELYKGGIKLSSENVPDVEVRGFSKRHG